MVKPIFSQALAVDQIIDGDHSSPYSLQARKWGPAVLGTAATVTYSYLSASQLVDRSGDGTEFALDRAEAARVDGYIRLIEDVANIDFVRVGFGSDAGDLDIQQRATNLGNTPRHTETRPGPDLLRPTTVTFAAGMTETSTFNQRHALHEILHGIGLNHPGPYDGGRRGGKSYDKNATHFQDSNQYTIMSYWDGTETGASYTRPDSATLMLHDVLAVQKLYGANRGAFGGNTVYGFGSNTRRDVWTATDAADNMFGAIWDTGGTDTIDASGYAARSILDLRENRFSSLNGQTFNLSIVPGSVIENAIGGGGNDRLVGNGVGNRLSGMGGNDTLAGRGGADVMHGGAGVDTVDYMTAEGGNEIDLAAGTARSLSGRTVEAVIWIENVLGSQGDDRIFGTAAANDLEGEGGDDLIVGRDGNDTLEGEAADDTLSGGAGSDVLIGGVGADTLSGGTGADRFRYAKVSDSPAGGIDEILDYDAGVDRVDLRAIDPNPFLGGDQAFDFLGVVARGVPTPLGSLYVRAAGGDTLLLANLDGDRNAEFGVRLVDGAVSPAAYGLDDILV